MLVNVTFLKQEINYFNDLPNLPHGHIFSAKSAGHTKTESKHASASLIFCMKTSSAETKLQFKTLI